MLRSYRIEPLMKKTDTLGFVLGAFVAAFFRLFT